MPSKSKSFLSLYFQPHLSLGLVEHVFSFVLTTSWMCLLSFSPQSGDSSQWSCCLPGSDQHSILGPCSCSLLSNYMVVTSGKILCGISYPCASWVTWDYQVSSKFLLGASPFAFDVMVPIREGVRERLRVVHHTWVQTLRAKASWAPSVYTSETYQVWRVCRIFPFCSPLLRRSVQLSGY